MRMLEEGCEGCGLFSGVKTWYKPPPLILCPRGCHSNQFLMILSKPKGRHDQKQGQLMQTRHNCGTIAISLSGYKTSAWHRE